MRTPIHFNDAAKGYAFCIKIGRNLQSENPATVVAGFSEWIIKTEDLRMNKGN